MRRFLATLSVILSAAIIHAAPPPFGQWEATGDASLWIDRQGSQGDQMTVLGFEGDTLLNSYTAADGDESTGTLRSPAFVLNADWMNFLIGGGDQPTSLTMNLIVDGIVVRSATGHDSEVLRWESWNISAWRGSQAILEIRDNSTLRWGHILIDEIMQEETPRMKNFQNPDINTAMNSLMRVIEQVADDPTRPAFHFHPPALWINDPNGPIFHDGFYHIFYQHNPFGDLWGPMHWGHARSRDLVRWEHLPIALAPEDGESGVWSGSAFIGPNGVPKLFYTSIRDGKPANLYAEQHVAVPVGPELIHWERHPANPILLPEDHPGFTVEEWRDPFLFRHGADTFMVLAARIIEGDSTSSGVILYRAKDDTLLDWEFAGIPFRKELQNEGIFECPNLFQIDGKWCLILSAPGWQTEYFIGDFDPVEPRFTVHNQGTLDIGGEYFYAPNTLINDPLGRLILWGWIRQFPESRGWNGALTIPRELYLTPTGTLGQRPIADLDKLRGAEIPMNPSGKNPDGIHLPPTSEFHLSGIDRPTLLSIQEKHSGFALEISVEENAVAIDGNSHELSPSAEWEIRGFLDRSVLEVFINEEIVLTKVLSLPEKTAPEFRLLPPAATSNAQAWTMNPITQPINFSPYFTIEE